MDSDIALYNWTPLVRMLLVGACIALLPLLLVWKKNRQRGSAGVAQALTVFTLFLTFDLILFGAFTRLTDSGLGCPDWPGCYGSASPIGASQQIQAAQTAVPGGPVTLSKAWIEMIHRYLATTVGALILTLCAISCWHWFWRRRVLRSYAHVRMRTHFGQPHPIWSLVTLIWVVLQGAFGALTVTMKLFPAIVTLHLLAGIVLLLLLLVQAEQWRLLNQSLKRIAIKDWLRFLCWLMFGVLFLQIAFGGWVSTNYAVLACATFPDCNGSYWPEMNFSQGFQIWRQLGLLRDGSMIEFPAQVAIHYTHRLFSVVVVTVTIALTIGLWRQGSQEVRKLAIWLFALTSAQVITGLSNVVLGWPLLAAVLHTAGASAMAFVNTQILVRTCGHKQVRNQDRDVDDIEPLAVENPHALNNSNTNGQRHHG